MLGITEKKEIEHAKNKELLEKQELTLEFENLRNTQKKDLLLYEHELKMERMKQELTNDIRRVEIQRELADYFSNAMKKEKKKSDSANTDTKASDESEKKANARLISQYQ